jgi:hypothetical protein
LSTNTNIANLHSADSEFKNIWNAIVDIRKPLTPEEIETAYAYDDDTITSKLVKNLSVDSETLDKILNECFQYPRGGLPGTKLSLLTSLASNPNLSNDSLWRIVNSSEFMHIAAISPKLSPAMLPILFKRKGFQVLFNLAKNPNLTEDAYRVIYNRSKGNRGQRYSKETVLKSLSENSSTPLEIAIQIAQIDINYQDSVFRNSRYAENVYEKINFNPSALLASLTNPHVSSSYLEEFYRKYLSNNFYENSYRNLGLDNLVRNPNLNMDTINELKQIDDSLLMKTFIRNPALPVEIIEEIFFAFNLDPTNEYTVIGDFEVYHKVISLIEENKVSAYFVTKCLQTKFAHPMVQEAAIKSIQAQREDVTSCIKSWCKIPQTSFWFERDLIPILLNRNSPIYNYFIEYIKTEYETDISAFSDELIRYTLGWSK